MRQKYMLHFLDQQRSNEKIMQRSKPLRPDNSITGESSLARKKRKAEQLKGPPSRI